VTRPWRRRVPTKKCRACGLWHPVDRVRCEPGCLTLFVRVKEAA